MAEIDGTKNLRALLENDKPIIVLEGSTRSTKTYSIIQYIVMMCLQSKIIARSFRSDQTVCRKTLVPDFLSILANNFPELGLDGWNKTEACYTFSNGSKYFFDGCDPAKLHGMKQDIAHLNEVMEIEFASWNQIKIRTSGLKIFDYNPSLTHHWLFNTVMKRSEGKFNYIHSTYKDNPFLEDEQVAEIEAWEPTKENINQGTNDKWLWEVYGLGKRGRRKGTIYTRWEITEQWPERMACNRWGYGLDFGFSIDPTALIECCLFQDELYVRERIYETGLVATISESNPNFPSIERSMKELKVDKYAKIIADRARPDSIADLAGVGYNVIPYHQSTNAINPGIQRLQRFSIKVHIGSQNLQRELENYTWKIDPKTEEVTDIPIDKFNHALDAIRYWGMENLEPVRVQNYDAYSEDQESYDPYSLLRG
jgi:phage terminase large subunit